MKSQQIPQKAGPLRQPARAFLWPASPPTMRGDHTGEYRSLAEFAEEITRETGPEIPAALQYYIDWEAMGRDMELNGDVFTITLGFDEVHVFWNR